MIDAARVSKPAYEEMSSQSVPILVTGTWTWSKCGNFGKSAATCATSEYHPSGGSFSGAWQGRASDNSPSGPVYGIVEFQVRLRRTMGRANRGPPFTHPPQRDDVPRSCGRLYSRSLFHFKRNSGLVCKFTPSYATRAPGGPSKTRKPPQTLSDPSPSEKHGRVSRARPFQSPPFLVRYVCHLLAKGSGKFPWPGNFRHVQAIAIALGSEWLVPGH